jgi:hypothetical protein
MKKIILILMVFATIYSHAQEKIATNTYVYGDLKNSMNGKILVRYLIDDPKSEKKVIDIFSDNGFDAISWNKLFLPGQDYTDSSINNELAKRNIETVIYIKHAGSTSYTQGTSNSFIGAKSIYTTGTSQSVVGSVSIDFEIYSKSNEYVSPKAIVKSTANNGWGAAGSERGLVLKIVNRIVKNTKLYL